MQCTNCGFAVNQEDNVCSNCGHSLKSGFSPTSGTSPAPQVQPPLKKKNSCLPIAVLIGVVGAGFLLLIIFGFGRTILGSRSSVADNTYSPENAINIQQTQQQVTIEAKNANFDSWVTYVRVTDEFLTEWDALYQAASESNRIELPEIIDAMLAAQSNLSNLSFNSRFNSTHEILEGAIGLAIKGFQVWHSGEAGSQELMDGYFQDRAKWLENLNAIEH